MLALVIGCSERAPIVEHPAPRNSRSTPSAAPTPAPPAASAPSASASVDAPPPEPIVDVAITEPSGRAAYTRDGALWVVDTKGASPRRLLSLDRIDVVNHDANVPEIATTSLSSLAFSPDGTRLYFMKPGWATSMALYYVELASGRVFFFHDANGYSLIEACADRRRVGQVITFEHSYFDVNPGGASDLFFLVDPTEPGPREARTGKSGRLGIVGPTEENVKRFLHAACKTGKPVPPPANNVPARFRAKVVKCPTLTLEHDDLEYLDGTKEIRFKPVGPDAPDEMRIPLEDAITLCAPSPPS